MFATVSHFAAYVDSANTVERLEPGFRRHPVDARPVNTHEPLQVGVSQNTGVTTADAEARRDDESHRRDEGRCELSLHRPPVRSLGGNAHRIWALFSNSVNRPIGTIPIEGDLDAQHDAEFGPPLDAFSPFPRHPIARPSRRARTVTTRRYVAWSALVGVAGTSCRQPRCDGRRIRPSHVSQPIFRRALARGMERTRAVPDTDAAAAAHTRSTASPLSSGSSGSPMSQLAWKARRSHGHPTAVGRLRRLAGSWLERNGASN